MASTSYEDTLRIARQLTPGEQAQLIAELDGENRSLDQATHLSAREEQRLDLEQRSPAEGSDGELGAQFVAYLDSLPFTDEDRADFDTMKQTIDEGCERYGL